MDPLSIPPHANKSTRCVTQLEALYTELNEVDISFGYLKLELNKHEELLSKPHISTY